MTLRIAGRSHHQTEWHRIWQRLRESGFILLFSSAIFLTIGLLTFDIKEPLWSGFAGTVHFQNAGGRLGAWSSDLLYSLFGIFAYLWPLGLFYLGLHLLYQKRIREPMEPWIWGVRSLGWMFCLIAGCSLSSLWISPLKAIHLPMGWGGVIGQWILTYLKPTLGLWGTHLFLGALLVIGLGFMTGISLFSFPAFFKIKKKGLSVQGLIKSVNLRSRREPIVNSTFTEDLEPKQTLLATNTVNKNTALSLALLQPDLSVQVSALNDTQLQSLSRDLEARLQDFGIPVEVVAAHPGPVITQFELLPAPGVKVSRVVSLSKDLARALRVSRVRVVEVLPGKSTIGLEIPNPDRELVSLRSVLESSAYQEANTPLTLALGKDISGHPVVANLAKMPHLLVAGTTGSGKSVGINAMLLSLLYKTSPEQLRLILIDPKMLELSVYEAIPHLLTPVVTDMKEAAQVLRWCVGEMEHRYQLMANVGVRHIEGYNEKVQKKGKVSATETSMDSLIPLPYIVVIVDEFADMMITVGKKVEELIARMAQKARAAGIHLILATQRPSVDVITGLIKANIPTRMAFQVSSRIDSRTILDQMGAEQLLGYGDMLYLPPGAGLPIRIHGAYVSDEEVHAVVDALRSQGDPNYVLNLPSAGGSGTEQDRFDFDLGETDALFEEAVRFITETRKTSISALQRRFKIGYNRAARLIESMEAGGLLSPVQANGNREVLAE